MTPTINVASDIARRVKRADPNLFIILGGAHATLLPEETLTSAPEIDVIVIRKTIQFAKKLKVDFAQFAITTPFPGTELYKLYLESKRSSVSWGNFVYAGTGSKVTPVFENDEAELDLQYWARRAYKEFYLRPSYLWQRIRQITSLEDLKVNAKGFSMLLGNINPLQKGKA